jgi:hypothetical protein
MSTLQISAPLTARSPVAAPRRPSLVLRAFHAIVVAMAETNRLRAERELKAVRRYRHESADRT